VAIDDEIFEDAQIAPLKAESEVSLIPKFSAAERPAAGMPAFGR
jgi:hypothetical protein